VVSSLWFKYHTTLEATLMQDATALQIAMRTLLRDRYWLTDCRPLGPIAIKNIQTRMAMRNPRDVITEEEVTELLSPEFGFQKAVAEDGEFLGWHLPALAEQRGLMLDARVVDTEKKRAQRAKQLGNAAPAVVAATSGQSAPAVAHSDDF
jgi:hypothetical protein